MCAADDCDQEVRARGLCEKHYRRLLRSGDASIKRKPGRPADPWRLQLRSLMGDCFSERTFNEYAAAMRTLHAFCRDQDEVIEAITAATRPNGTLNVSKLRRLADASLMRYVDREQA